MCALLRRCGDFTRAQLHFQQLTVDPARAGEQLLVGPVLHHLPMVEDQNAVEALDGREPMGHTLVVRPADSRSMA